MTLIDGKAISEQVKQEIAAEVAEIVAKGGKCPHLAAILVSVGLNYYPMKDIVVKAEYSKRFLKSQYNNEPSFSLGIAYAGFFIK